MEGYFVIVVAAKITTRKYRRVFYDNLTKRDFISRGSYFCRKHICGVGNLS